MRDWSYSLGLVAVVIGLVFATAAAAETLPRLPGALAIPMAEGSMGQVVFNHVTHVDQEKPDCTVCHPSVFRILGTGSPAGRETITHEEMGQGRQCGTCHNGQAAFSLADAENCAACHTMDGP